MSTVLITGASRGIGAALAIQAAASGRYKKCIITGFSHKERLLEVKDQVISVQNYGEDFQCITSIGDVSDIHYIEELYQKEGAVDVLINNAAISITGLMIDMTPDQWNRILNVNVTSIYNTCHTFTPDMIRNKSGKIINISSVWGEKGASCEAAYSATKGAVNSFTKALARELAPSNIQVNAVAFGMVDTEMNSQLSAEDVENIRDEIPAGYILDTVKAAEAVMKIIDMPDYMNGQIITVDGCWM